MHILFTFLSLCTSLFLISPGDKAQLAPAESRDSLRAEIAFLPKEIIVDQPEEGFVVREITVLNKGGAPLDIYSATPSCGCASVAVLDSRILPMGIGKLRLSVNTKTFSDSLNRVEYIISSNALESTVSYNLIVRRAKK